MVSFSCEECGDVLTKKKLDPHRGRCRRATFTCLDCMVHFNGNDYRSHTSCITEDQKYQGALYKEKNKRQKKDQDQSSTKPTTKKMAQPAYVEDVGADGDYESWDDVGDDVLDPLPEAPTPPSAAIMDEDQVNVFDYLVATGQTPNASNMNLPAHNPEPDSTSLVRYERQEADSLDPLAYMEQDEPLISYGSGPITQKPVTPAAAKAERRRARDSDAKKDKKRKRLHVDVPGDQVMTDAPPVLHSGLTGGLKGLLKTQLPPSPDYSGNDVAEPATSSPLKKSKHSKHAKHSHISGGLFGMMTGASKSKSKTKKRSKSKKSSSRSHGHKEDKAPKLIEFRPHSRDDKGDADGTDNDNQLVVYKPRGDVFLSFVDKGPESLRGCSMNKTLKRFHRSRKASGSSIGKGREEKELFRSLRLRRNDRGEIVLFSEVFDLDEVEV